MEAFGIQAPDADESDPDVDHLDPLGVVRPGDSSSLGTLVARSLGYSSTYSDEVVEKVRSLQEEYGLEPDGIVRGLTWTLVLPIGWTPESAGAEWFVFEDLGGTVDMLPDGRMDRTLWKKLWLDRFAERL